MNQTSFEAGLVNLKRCLAVLLVLWPLSVRADSLELKPHIEVDSQGVFLEQIVTGKNTERLSNIFLAPAPDWGRTRTLKRPEINQLLAKVAPAIATIELAGAAEVKISRQSRKLEEKEVIKILAEKLQPKGGSEKAGGLELRWAREWKPVPVPTEPIDLRLIMQPSSGLSALFMVRFEILSGEELIGTYTANLTARLLREVWVARSAIQRGTTLDVADIAKDRVDVIRVREPVWTGQELNSTCRVVEHIPAGGVVFARAVQQRPIVRRGQRVQAVASDGLLSVSIQAEALEDGTPDQIIRARNLRTRKEIRGKVLNEDTIQVVF